jgi:hypothetical protein
VSHTLQLDWNDLHAYIQTQKWSGGELPRVVIPGVEEIEWPSDKKGRAKAAPSLKKSKEKDFPVSDEDEAECEDDGDDNDEEEKDDDDDADADDGSVLDRMRKALEWFVQDARRRGYTPICEDDTEINDMIKKYSLAEAEAMVVAGTPAPEPDLLMMSPQPQTTACSAPNSPLPAFPRSPLVVATHAPEPVAMVLGENTYDL